MKEFEKKKHQHPWVQERLEQMRMEFVQHRFKEIMGHYETLANMSKKLEVGKYIESHMMDEYNLPDARPVALDPSILKSQYLTQEQLQELFNYVTDYDKSSVDSVTDQRYVSFYFWNRCHGSQHLTELSHSLIWFTPFGRLQECIDNREDDLIEIDIEAGNGKGIKQAVMRFRLEDDHLHHIELEDFCILSLIKNSKDEEVAVFSVFNRELDVLYCEIINGTPTIEQAKLPLTLQTKTAGDDAVQPDSATPDDSTQKKA